MTDWPAYTHAMSEVVEQRYRMVELLPTPPILALYRAELERQQARARAAADTTEVLAVVARRHPHPERPYRAPDAL